MKKNKLKGNESFLALVLSDKRPDFRDILIHKVDVYIRFAPIFEKECLMVKKKDFARHLAMHSNLADNENYETRVETIYHGLKYYKKLYQSFSVE